MDVVVFFDDFATFHDRTNIDLLCQNTWIWGFLALSLPHAWQRTFHLRCIPMENWNHANFHILTIEFEMLGALKQSPLVLKGTSIGGALITEASSKLPNGTWDLFLKAKNRDINGDLFPFSNVFCIFPWRKTQSMSLCTKIGWMRSITGWSTHRSIKNGSSCCAWLEAV